MATFEIRDNVLYLKDIEVYKGGSMSDKANWKSIFKELFPKQEFLKVDWRTGLLVLPYGKMLKYVHGGYASTYENYIILEIDNGNLTKEKQLKYKDYEKFKRKQFRAFKKTEAYKNLRKLGRTNDYLRFNVTDYTSKILIE